MKINKTDVDNVISEIYNSMSSCTGKGFAIQMKNGMRLADGTRSVWRSKSAASKYLNDFISSSLRSYNADNNDVFGLGVSQYGYSSAPDRDFVKSVRYEMEQQGLIEVVEI